MAANKIIRFGPVPLTTTLTTNLINPALGSLAGPLGFTMTQPYVMVKHLRVINKTTAALSFSLWLGATGANGAGTEVIGQGKSVSPNDAYDWYPNPSLRLDAADFLVGGANALGLTLEGEGEIGIS